MKNYYNEIAELIEEMEAKRYVREVNNKNDALKTYREIGGLLVEAQGGEHKDNEGNKLIKKLSKMLIKEYGENYNTDNLKSMREYYYYKYYTEYEKLKQNISELVLKVNDEIIKKHKIN